MNTRTLRAGALALGLAGLALHTHAQVQIYGTVDLAYGRIETQPPGAPNAAITKITGVHNGGLQTSYLGIKGSEDLGDGLSAKYQMEAFFRADTGQFGRFDASPTSAADPFWSRETFVGLAGGFGEVRLGANAHPTWVSMLLSNALGANSVFSPSFRQMFNGGTRGLSEADTALANSIRFVSKNYGGLEGSVALQFAEGTGNNSKSANLIYRSGPLMVTAAYSHIRHAAIPANAADRNQTQTLLGGAYNFGPVRAFAQLARFKNDRLNTQDKLQHFGVTAPLGSGELQFSRGDDKTTGASTGKRTTTTLGYVYGLSKRTDLYAFAMTDKVSVGTATSQAIGIRHKF